MHLPKLHDATLELPFAGASGGPGASPAPGPFCGPLGEGLPPEEALLAQGLGLDSRAETEGHAATTPHPPRAALTGEVAFASPEVQVQRTAELLGAGAVVVVVAPPTRMMRGHLAERLDDLVERELGARGAPSPYLTEWSAMPDDAEARLADQLFRARTVGATGIAFMMGSLASIAVPALTPEDSATLRVLRKASESVPLIVLLDDGDAHLGAYARPVALGAMLELGGRGHDLRRSARDLAIPTETVTPPPIAAETANAVETHFEANPEANLEANPEANLEANPEANLETETVVDAPVAERRAATRPETHDRDRGRAREAAHKRATVGVPVAGPLDYWRSWAIALGAARGPQPLAAFERLFVESYMPLANAIATGVDDPRAIRAHDEFQHGFERSYTDAFATFGATGRRPRLVMDAFDVATKLARLHNARTAHVLIVDAMRHDLGCLVRDALTERAAGIASLTGESLLWSALPTTTFRQLETLARGMDALRAPTPEEASESLRGRSAEAVRRMRVGSRELYKLDVVPAMLGALPDPALGGGPAQVVAALASIADGVAESVQRHLQSLPPRTLLLVIGDHGFCVDRRGRVTHGGATPEEVLVPSLGYLVGDLH